MIMIKCIIVLIIWIKWVNGSNNELMNEWINGLNGLMN